MARGRWRVVVPALMLGSAGLVAGLAMGGLERLVPHTPRDSRKLLGHAPPIVAHRGFSGQAPENTLAAFHRAASLGVMVELDVTLASTGEVVVIHDDTLERTTDGTGEVSETPLDTIRTLDAGRWFGAAFAGERVPTLDDVLAQVDPAVVLDIELKTTEAKSALASAVVQAVRRAGALERVFVSSFDPLLLEQVRRIEPSIRRAQLVDTFDGTDVAFYKRVILRNLGLNAFARPDMVIGGNRFVTEAWVRRQKARGYVVMVYTVNDPARMRVLWNWGVDAVITDRPDRALAAVQSGA